MVEEQGWESPAGDQACHGGKENIHPEARILGKRKRKTERELRILRSELRKNVMWTRESIKQMRKKYESDFSMSEQQIYKWWWDQTRKRTKKNQSKKAPAPSNDGDSLVDQQACQGDDDMLISFQDEFGGYSSRLRLNAADGGARTPGGDNLGEDAN